MLKMTFGNITINNILGYKISVGIQPQSGFNGAFYVYVEEKLETGNNKLAPAQLGDASANPRGILAFAEDNHIDYSFSNIDLKAIKTVITHRERSRIIEFRYDPNVTDSNNQPNAVIKLNHKSTDKLTGALQDMKISVVGAAEELLAFNLFQQPIVPPVFRFSHRKNKDNSWLKKIIESNKDRNNGKPFKPFNITFAGQKAIDETNVQGLLIDESYGTMLDHPIASISDVAMKGTGDFINLARLDLQEYDPRTLVKMYNSKEFNRGAISGMTVETATVIFKTGLHTDINIL